MIGSPSVLGESAPFIFWQHCQPALELGMPKSLASVAAVRSSPRPLTRSLDWSMRMTTSRGHVRHRHLLLMFIVGVALICTSSSAAPITFGPFLDAKGFLSPVQRTVIPTSLFVLLPIPMDGFLPLTIRDRITGDSSRSATLVPRAHLGEG